MNVQSLLMKIKSIFVFTFYLDLHFLLYVNFFELLQNFILWIFSIFDF